MRFGSVLTFSFSYASAALPWTRFRGGNPSPRIYAPVRRDGAATSEEEQDVKCKSNEDDVAGRGRLPLQFSSLLLSVKTPSCVGTRQSNCQKRGRKDVLAG